MPSTAKPEERERPEPVFGVTDEALEEFDLITSDPSELTEGGLGDIECTIIGFDIQAGGEERTREEDNSTYITQDQLQMHLRIDNAEDLALDFETTIQYFSLPKARTGGDGVRARGRATRSSKYGIWLATLDGLGISVNAENAHLFHMTSGIRDLIGLQFHRVTETFQTFGTNEIRVEIPHEIHGFDNALRKKQKLPAAELKAA